MHRLSQKTSAEFWSYIWGQRVRNKTSKDNSKFLKVSQYRWNKDVLRKASTKASLPLKAFAIFWSSKGLDSGVWVWENQKDKTKPPEQFEKYKYKHFKDNQKLGKFCEEHETNTSKLNFTKL